MFGKPKLFTLETDNREERGVVGIKDKEGRCFLCGETGFFCRETGGRLGGVASTAKVMGIP